MYIIMAYTYTLFLSTIPVAYAHDNANTIDKYECEILTVHRQLLSII